VNNTGTKKGSIIKINGIWRERNGECAACLKNIQYLYLLKKYKK
jgi:hypothetical protein